MSLIDQFLLSLNILEHVFRLWNAHIVREHFRVVFVEFKHAWQSILRLFVSVEALQVLREIIEDQILLENGNDMPLLIIHDISCYL